jgi:short-subunit dehydrogenase
MSRLKNEVMDFRARYGPWAIVAGASEGTGRSFARQIAANGVSCILIANGGPLEAVRDEIRSESSVDCVTALIDLSAPEAFDQIVAATARREIGLYVANAGTDVHGSRFLERDVKAWLDLIRINVFTTIQSCHYFGKLMLDRRRGGLILVNSGACYGGAGRLATYTACKAFQLNLSESLWSEFREYGVDVLSIVLGQTDTPAYHRLQAKKGMPSAPNLASPDVAARTALARLPHGPVHNFGLADDEIGGLLASANVRRERVLFMDAAVEHLFGRADS